MYEKYGLAAEVEDDSYESELNNETNVPLYKVVLAVNQPKSERKNSEDRQLEELQSPSIETIEPMEPMESTDDLNLKEDFRVHVRPQSTFEEGMGGRGRFARSSFQAHRLRRHVQRHSCG